MSILLALISHIGWGVGDIFVVLTTRKIGTNGISFWTLFVSFITLLFFVPFFSSDFSKLTWESFWLILVLSVFLLVAHMSFNEGMRIGSPSLVGAISASFVAVSVILSLIFLGEHLSFRDAFFVGLIILGVALCLMGKDFHFEWGRGEIMALGAMVGWGIYYAFIKIAIVQVGWFVPAFIFAALFPLVALFSYFTKGTISSPFKKSTVVVFFLSVILIGAAEFCYNIAISSGGDVSKILPIAGSYPALFVLLSSIIFHEKILHHQWMGICAALTGIIALSFLG